MYYIPCLPLSLSLSLSLLASVRAILLSFFALNEQRTERIRFVYFLFSFTKISFPKTIKSDVFQEVYKSVTSALIFGGGCSDRLGSFSSLYFNLPKFYSDSVLFLISETFYLLWFSEFYPKTQLVPCSKHTPSQL